jgi:hypothetical protein
MSSASPTRPIKKAGIRRLEARATLLWVGPYSKRAKYVTDKTPTIIAMPPK